MTLKLIKDDNKTINNKIDILSQLNPQQKKAVEQIDGPILVIAGAGSGKTRVLTYKIAHLVNVGVMPWNILALTFTNKAASEMKERISKIVSSSAINNLWSGTFHSVFARILRTEAQHIGYDRSFSIYDTDDSNSAIKNVMNAMGISLQQFPPQGMRHRISMAKNKMMTWQDYAGNADNPVEKQTAMVYQAYEERLKTANAMDFDDLLLNIIKLFVDNKSILEKYQDRFKYLLVDEYQDTNRAQYMAVKMLSAKTRNICVVGDDAQSIYKWRGADIRNILDFKKDYPESKVIPLEQNYRSTKHILGAADSIIRRNNNQIQKTLWTNNPDGEKIEIISCIDDKDESQRVVNLIRRKINDEEFSAKDIAILYRTNAQSLAIENALRSEKIPYIIIGGISFYKRKEIKDAVAYLKLLNNPKDSEALLRIINEPPRGLGQTSLNHLQNYALKQNISLFGAIKDAHLVSNLQQRAVNAANNFANFLESAISKLNSMPLKELIFEYIEASGLLEMYKEIGSTESLDRWNNIQQLLSDLSEFLRNNPESSLEDYLQQISLISDIDDKELGDDQVKLMTLHSAKGLEFPIVFITGMEHGLFPLSKSELAREEEEEERRLFYVGITRAMEKLYLTYSARRAKFGEYRNSSPSHFLNEIDSKFLIRSDHRMISSNSSDRISSIGNSANYQFNMNNRHPTDNSLFNQRASAKGEVSKPNQNSNYFDDIQHNDNYSQIPEEMPTLMIGDYVSHHTFGKGKLLSLSGIGKNTKALVQFESVGRKVLMLHYAKLIKL